MERLDHICHSRNWDLHKTPKMLKASFRSCRQVNTEQSLCSVKEYGTIHSPGALAIKRARFKMGRLNS